MSNIPTTIPELIDTFVDEVVSREI